MNVNDLIEKLQHVKNKKKKVKLAVNGKVVSDFHINDDISTTLYLSNQNEESYIEPIIGG